MSLNIAICSSDPNQSATNRIRISERKKNYTTLHHVIHSFHPQISLATPTHPFFQFFGFLPGPERVDAWPPPRSPALTRSGGHPISGAAPSPSPMALQTLNPHRHAAAASPAPSPVPRRGHPPPQPLLHLLPRRRLAGGAARPRAVAAAVSGAVNEARRRGAPQEAGEDGRKDTDLATLGNLCVDVVLSVPQLPPAPREERKAYMERLAASPPDQVLVTVTNCCGVV